MHERRLFKHDNTGIVKQPSPLRRVTARPVFYTARESNAKAMRYASKNNA